MNTSMSISSSGLHVSQIKQDVVGNNLANVNTGDFDQSRVTQNEIKGGGVEVASIDKMPTQGVQIDEQMVQMIRNEKELGFNAQAIKTQDQMLGEILDLKR